MLMKEALLRASRTTWLGLGLGLGVWRATYYGYTYDGGPLTTYYGGCGCSRPKGAAILTMGILTMAILTMGVHLQLLEAECRLHTYYGYTYYGYTYYGGPPAAARGRVPPP
eukprot:scaffold124067_cov48-Phaeocystis_antarctica.AAC.3